MRRPGILHSLEAGFTMIELLVTITLMTLVAGMLSMILFTSNRAHRETTGRAEIQGSSRSAMSLLTTELQQAGADPGTPPLGLVAILSADTNAIRIRADLNGNGAIETAEPSEDVTYTYDAGTGTVTRNPGSGAVAVLNQVTDFRLSYFDASNNPLATLPLSAPDRGLVHSIAITMTCDDQDAQPFTSTTRVTLRNQ